MTRRAPNELARADFAAIPRYGSADAAPVNLADNTNLWGSPPAVVERLARLAAEGAAAYPDAYGGSLKAVVAERAGVTPACVVTGNGSDDILDCAIRAFAGAGDRLAFGEPTFVMLPVFSRVNSVTPVATPLTPEGAVDAEALLATEARIVYVCNPNNPTGTETPDAVIRRLVDEAPGLVIVDEAYAEFTGRSGLLAEAPAMERLLVCRTMSKAYGLAGLRVGYATASPAIVEMIERSRGPYRLNAAAEAAAVVAMTEGRAWMEARAAEAIASREGLSARLRALGLAPLPSSANFVCVPTPRASAAGGRLREAGIAVRVFPPLPGLGEALRITVGPWPVMERLLAALEEALACA